MSIGEENKNKKLSYKYSSHTTNLLKIPPFSGGTINEKFSNERKKAIRATHRFHNFIKNIFK